MNKRSLYHATMILRFNPVSYVHGQNINHYGGGHSVSTGLLDIDERTNLTANNKVELLLFRLGEAHDGKQRELFGNNVSLLQNS